MVYATWSAPDRVLLKACGSRRATRCASCSVVYKGDARALVAAGLAGGKGIAESVGQHPAVFVTLTAPSFGAVHGYSRQVPGQPCHPGRPGLRCPHGVALACPVVHQPDDACLGTPLCPGCYDYRGAVIWNARASELWRRTTIAIRRALAGQLGVPVRALSQRAVVSFAKVVEFQRRGVVHLHGVIRLDGPDGEDPGIDASVLVAAVSLAANRAKAPNPLDAARPVARGAQLEVAPIQADGRRAVANYLANYATKSTDEAGALDHRLSAADLEHLEVSNHLGRLVATAWELGGQEALAGLRLRHWAHCLGFRGHWLTKSRCYSTTFGALREARHAWRLAQVHGGEPVDPWGRPLTTGAAVVVASWAYSGVGYQTSGDTWLAASVGAQMAENRRVAREERPCLGSPGDQPSHGRGGGSGGPTTPRRRS